VFFFSQNMYLSLQFFTYSPWSRWSINCLVSRFGLNFRVGELVSDGNLSTSFHDLRKTCRQVGERNPSGLNLSTTLFLAFRTCRLVDTTCQLLCVWLTEPVNRLPLVTWSHSPTVVQRLLFRIEVWILSWHVCTKPVDYFVYALHNLSTGRREKALGT